MPNYCSNHLYIKHQDPEMMKAVEEAANAEELFQRFIPVPEALLNTIKGSFGDPEEQAALNRKCEENMREYGYPTWYEFCYDQWGTKWDICDASVSRIGDKVFVDFTTAWSPPLAFYDTMVKDLGFEITAYYYEPGCAFCGMYEDGDNIDYDISGGSNWISENIPSDIDTEMNISESMQEWEYEEEEDEDDVDELNKDVDTLIDN